MVDKVLKILLLFSPLVYVTGMNLDILSIRFFHLGVVALFMATLWDRPKRELGEYTIPILSLLGLCGLSLFTHGFQNVNLITFRNLFFACLALVIIIRYLESPERCYKYIVLAGILNIVIFILQRIFRFNPILDKVISDPLFYQQFGGMFGLSTRLATYIALILPFIFHYSWILALIFIAVVFLSKEYVTIVALIVILLMKVKDLRYRISILAGMFISISFLHVQFSRAITFRWQNVWREAIYAFFDRPLIGYGLGKFYQQWGTDPFNSYLPFIFGVGILGIVWLVYIFRRLKIDRGLESIALVGFLVLATVEYPVEIPRLWWTIVAIVGFYIIGAIKRRQVCG